MSDELKFIKVPCKLTLGIEQAILTAIPKLSPNEVRLLWGMIIQYAVGNYQENKNE